MSQTPPTQSFLLASRRKSSDFRFISLQIDSRKIACAIGGRIVATETLSRTIWHEPSLR
jgi:hypothetical protein